MKSTNVTSDHIDQWETSERDGNITATSVAVKVGARSPREVDLGPSCRGIIVLTAVWASACGLEHKTPLSSTRIVSDLSPRQCSSRCRCVGGSSIRVLLIRVQIVRPSAIVAIIGLCVGGLAPVSRDCYFCASF